MKHAAVQLGLCAKPASSAAILNSVLQSSAVLCLGFFGFKRPLSGIWRAFATLTLSLNVRERKGLNKWLSSFRRTKKRNSCWLPQHRSWGRRQGKLHLRPSPARRGSEVRKASLRPGKLQLRQHADTASVLGPPRQTCRRTGG